MDKKGSVFTARLAQNQVGEANALSTLGEVYAAMGHHIEALNSYQKALRNFYFD